MRHAPAIPGRRCCVGGAWRARRGAGDSDATDARRLARFWADQPEAARDRRAADDG
ncbi:MAG TPA: hypothetical protein VM490_07310 [Armatimonadaceae bacterium]|nr:hypothetical protein [Armatimonadaceae bacterium]